LLQAQHLATCVWAETYSPEQIRGLSTVWDRGEDAMDARFTLDYAEVLEQLAPQFAGGR
jgi:hypothetical protein